MSTSQSQFDSTSAHHHDDTELLAMLRDRLAARQELLPELADQLRSAVQQTEVAVLEISERFMNIAGRARRQLQSTMEITESLAHHHKPFSASHNARTATPEQLASTLEGLSAETEMLGNDINGIITSLQFQDITRQQIEKVIGRISLFQQELNDIKRSLESGNASAQGSMERCACGAEVNRGEHD